jgi:hypothetical protein
MFISTVVPDTIQNPITHSLSCPVCQKPENTKCTSILLYIDEKSFYYMCFSVKSEEWLLCASLLRQLRARILKKGVTVWQSSRSKNLLSCLFELFSFYYRQKLRQEDKKNGG